MINVRNIDHLVIRVRDVARMTAFYRDVLGLPVAKINTQVGIVHLRAGSTMIDLVPVSGVLDKVAPPAERGERNLDHFCLRVEPFDEDAIARELVGHGVRVGAVATRFGAEGDGRSIYFEDPEGNRVELKGPST